jgi:flagellar basal-body rod protein FlgB
MSQGLFIRSITDRGATPALARTLAFDEERMRVIAENVANIDVVGYRMRSLDAKAFQRSLREALDARATNPQRPFKLPRTPQTWEDEAGRLRVAPSVSPPANVLSHDGTNHSIERLMSDLAETTMTHELATGLLRGQYEGLRKAIRGTV